MKAFPFVILTLGFCAVVAIPATTAAAVQYDRAAVHAGEWWRLITCQWAHWSASHLLWDLAVFLALGIVCERQGRAATVAAVALAATAVPMVVHLACPLVTTFRGLSGIDCALFGLLAGRLALDALARRDGRSLAVMGAALLLFALKTAFEMATGKTVFVAGSDGFAVVPAAHLVGLVAGLVATSIHLGTARFSEPVISSSLAIKPAGAGRAGKPR